MAPTLQLKLFGSPQISYQGQPLTGFVSAKVRALLIYLAVTARPHSRDHLAHLLWEDTPASMKTNLRKALSNLRQLVGDLLVEEGKDRIALDSQRCWVDVVAFEHALRSATLAEAAQLYTADFLDGFNPSLSYEFETWTLREQSRLKSQMVDLLRKIATQQETRNTLTEAIQTVRRLLDFEPWQEESHRWLMELLAKNGQRSAALAHFEVCKRVLQEELAVDPAPETMALVDKIQRAEIAPAPSAPKQPTHWTPEFPLFGREHEWATIQHTWQRSLTGGAHFIALAGEAGIGKTRLTEETRLWVARQGYAVAYARSYAAEGSLAYSPLVDWLRSDAINTALAQVEPLWLTEVARLLPELLTTFPQVAPPTPLLDSAQRRLFHEALARVLGAQQQPRLLIIDDLQWCDRDTLEWLRFLLRFDPTQPLLIIGAYRSEEVGRDHPLQKLLTALRREEIVTEIELGMLTMGDTTSLIHAASPVSRSQEQIAQVWRATAGHPLFIIESLRSTNEQGDHSTLPPKVQHVIQTRLAELSPAAHRLAMVAAVVGHAFSLALLGQAGKVEDDETLLLLLDELWTRRIILPRADDLYDFSHDRIREVVYAAIGPIQQRLLHQRVALALEKLYAANLTPILGELGAHYEQAGQPTPAIHYYQHAATHARAIYSHVELVHYLNKHLAMLRRLPNRASLAAEEIDLLLDLGLAYIFVNGWGAKAVGETWQQAHDLAFQNGSKFQQARVLLGLDIYFNNLGEMHTARAYSEKNLNFALVHLKDDDFLMQQVFGNYGGSLYHGGEIAKSLPYFNQMLAMHKPEIKPSFWWIHRDASTNALVRSAKTLWFLGYPDQARARCDKAAEIARKDFDLFTLTAALDFSGMVYSFCQDYAAVKRLGEEMIALATKYEFPYYWMIGKIYVGWASVQQEDLNAVAKMTEAITEFFATTLTRKFAPQRKAMWAEVLLKAGKPAAALQEIDEVLHLTQTSGNIYFNAHLLKLKGDCLLALRKEPAAVETVYQQAFTFAQQQGAKSLELRSAISLARLWQQQGRAEDAFRLLASLYGWFTEGFDTLDLIEAKQLLDDVATASQPNAQLPVLPATNTHFVAGPPITQPHLFFGRTMELTRIFGWWQATPLAHVTLIGPRRSGKTSLLRHLPAIATPPTPPLRANQRADWLPNPQRYRWLWVDFQDPRMRRQERLLTHLLTGFGLTPPTPCSLENFMDVACSHQWQAPVIVLMDELGAGLAAPELDQPFWWALRALTQATDGQLAFAIAAHESPMRLAEDQGKTSPFFNIFTTLALGPLTNSEAEELIATAPRPFADEDREWILSQSQGWPLLVQILCQERLVTLDRGESGETWRTAALQRLAPFDYLLGKAEQR